MDLNEAISELQILNAELQMENDRADERQRREEQRYHNECMRNFFDGTVKPAIFEKLDIVALAEAIKDCQNNYGPFVHAQIGSIIMDAVNAWEQGE